MRCEKLHRTDLLWGVATDTGLRAKSCSSLQALWSGLNCDLKTRRKTVILNWYIEWNVIHFNSTIVSGCSVHKNPHFGIHIRSDGTGCVFTTQLICKQSWRIHQVKLYFSCELCCREKYPWCDKALKVYAFCETQSETVCVFVCVLFEWMCVREIEDVHGWSCLVLSRLRPFQLLKLRPALVNIMYYK